MILYLMHVEWSNELDHIVLALFVANVDNTQHIMLMEGIVIAIVCRKRSAMYIKVVYSTWLYMCLSQLFHACFAREQCDW